MDRIIKKIEMLKERIKEISFPVIRKNFKPL